MGNNDNIRVVLGSLRYKSAPDTDLSLKVPFVQTSKEIIEFDRTIDVNLEEVFNRERQSSTTFRPAGKFQVLFQNAYTGITSYQPFRNNLYYVNAFADAALSCSGNNNATWAGYPQYNEFDFIRTDYDVKGYTQPPNQHLVFEPESASTYNWNFFMSYAFSSVTGQTMFVNFKDDPTNTFSWICGNGIPFIIQNIFINGNKLIAFKCPVKHGLSVGEFVQLSFQYNNQRIFPIYSLGLEEYGNEEYVFTIYNIGYTGNTFNNNNKGTFKRVINNENVNDTISKYYVRKHKILTNVNDAVLVNAGFEKNIFGATKKYETSALTPNNVARVSIKENCQSYTLSFNTDIDIQNLRDNQMRPVTELFFTVMYKGYFGWMFGNLTKGLQKGWEFNLPLVNNSPNPWWADNLSYTNFPILSYTTSPNTIQPPNGFTYVQSLKEGDILDGDFCEWNDFEQTERVISNHYHKFKFNTQIFNTGAKNKFGYYYQPHHPITLRVYSDYIENGDPKNVVDIPDYAHFSTSVNQFIWRDIYEYGFIDSTGRGVGYPFLNGTHYPFKNLIFRIIPEGSNYTEQNIILIPITDFCE